MTIDDLIITVVSNMPSVGVLVFLVYMQDKKITRLIDALIKRENCDDSPDNSENTPQDRE